MTKSLHRFIVMLCVFLLPAAGFAPVRPRRRDPYCLRGSLAAGWQDWSWSTTPNFSNTSPVYSGNSIRLP